jgi:long-chain acyl-CoA synthetase
MLSDATDGAPGVLLTGATGFLGGEVLTRLLEQDDRRVYALIRGADEGAAETRLRETLDGLVGDGARFHDRVTAVAGDVCSPGLGLADGRHDWLAERVDQIVHCAASVSFTLPLEEARAINVEGTRRMLDLAEHCGSRGTLPRFSHVSTAYVAGTHPGHFTEADLDVGQSFRNTYERTKYEAELLVRERGGAVPTQVLRPSIVVGDSRTGWTPAFNVLYMPLRAFARGAYPAIPARRSSPVDVVPVDYVADAILAPPGAPGTTRHLTAGDRASSVGELIEMATDYLDRPAPPVLPPRLYRRVLHPLLKRRSSGPRRRALERSETFFPYFEMRVRYDDARTREALAPLGIEPPPLPSYFGRLMRFAQAARWGRQPVPRHAAADAVA